MKCSKCQVVLKAEANFCHACGTSAQVAKAEAIYVTLRKAASEARAGDGSAVLVLVQKAAEEGASDPECRALIESLFDAGVPHDVITKALLAYPRVYEAYDRCVVKGEVDPYTQGKRLAKQAEEDRIEKAAADAIGPVERELLQRAEGMIAKSAVRLTKEQAIAQVLATDPELVTRLYNEGLPGYLTRNRA